jgi:hypothetical protein
VRRALVLAAFLAGLGAAAPAAAQVVTLRPYPGPGLHEGPQLVGERVAWSQTRCLTGCSLGASNSTGLLKIFNADRRGPPRTLFRARTERAYSGPDGGHETYWFLLSEGFLATAYELLVSAEAEFDSYGVARLRAGPQVGPRELLAACRSASFAGSAPVALDGSRLAYDPDPCDDLARLVVRDLATGEVRSLPEPAGGRHLRLRGRFAAWIAGEGSEAQLVVHDVVGGTVAYSAPAVDVLALDLDADGSVAAVTGSPSRPCRSGRLVRYSLAAPGPVPVDVPVCATGVRIDGGRMVFLGWEGFDRTFRAYDPNGSIQDLVRFGRVRPGGFDFEGER